MIFKLVFLSVLVFFQLSFLRMLKKKGFPNLEASADRYVIEVQAAVGLVGSLRWETRQMKILVSKTQDFTLEL